VWPKSTNQSINPSFFTCSSSFLAHARRENVLEGKNSSLRIAIRSTKWEKPPRRIESEANGEKEKKKEGQTNGARG